MDAGVAGSRPFGAAEETLPGALRRRRRRHRRRRLGRRGRGRGLRLPAPAFGARHQAPLRLHLGDHPTDAGARPILSLFFFFLLFLRPHWRPPRLQRGTFISFRSLPVVILLFSPTQQRANSKWKPVPTRDAEYFDFFFHPLPLLLLCGSIHSLNRYIYIAKNRHINHRFLTIVDARAKHRDSRIILARTIFQKQHGTFFFEFLRKNKIASTRSASKRDLA